MWEWKRHYGGAILDQMKRLGASVDWQREYFTMDERLSVAVREAFVRLYEQGLIYRGAYIVNWCPRCQTAISDLEVVYDEHKGHLWEIRYPVLGPDGKDSGEFLTVATTRPETMLGDMAVAIHPEDERYTHLHGKKLRLPLMDREIPIILDEWVSREFGTGAVKVTPAHDPNDFALGERHNLPSINVMDDTRAHQRGRRRLRGPRSLCGAQEDRRRSRSAGAAGRHQGPRPQRGPLRPLQDGGRAAALDAVVHAVKRRLQPRARWRRPSPRSSRRTAQGIRFTPENVREDLPQLDGEHPRLVHLAAALVGSSHSRVALQRVPQDHGARAKIRRQCAHCGSEKITQETDVLDTWFSSGLLPVSVFGWPNITPENRADFDAFYPTSLLVTGFDILFFWVARMIMLGCWFAGDVPMPDGSKRSLADSVPFREVYIHALVRDANREKMSKTKGNVIDPIEIVKQYGTDAVRFTLASMASPGTDIAFNVARTEGYRAFANKIWNAARFIFMNVDRAAEIGITVDPIDAGRSCRQLTADAPLEARWIVAELHATRSEGQPVA